MFFFPYTLAAHARVQWKFTVEIYLGVGHVPNLNDIFINFYFCPDQWKFIFPIDRGGRYYQYTGIYRYALFAVHRIGTSGEYRYYITLFTPFGRIHV